MANIVAGIGNINIKSCKTLAKQRNERKNIKAQERIEYSEILNHVIETKRRWSGKVVNHLCFPVDIDRNQGLSVC